VATDGSNRFAVLPTPGRARVAFIARTVRGHLSVTPTDAVPMVNSGRLDRRLFDVTALVSYGYDDRRGDLPLIVASSGGAANAAVRANSVNVNAVVTRDLPAVNGIAVRESRRHAAAFWDSVTTTPAAASTGGQAPRALRVEVDRIWLDAMRQPTLDVSVPLIGAPQAWAAGYTGDGVPVGVVDSGIDDTHPDLAGKVLAARNFTTDADTLDRIGHGTHVASILTGTGAASAGRYKGAAPGVQVYSAKVCVVGGCPESSILDGMWWAVADQHAKVVNMSIGGADTVDVDPLEQSVHELTARFGALFVVAAGNDGADGTVESPATADDALSVGAVTKTDQLADFSSRGPRLGDTGLKPDITGPGVDIVAARGRESRLGTPIDPDGRYMALSGTSMATPHVAASAAILAQQHPDWSPAQLKATLMAAARPNPTIGVYAQGAGRVDVARAIKQAITTSPASVSFGRQPWPHNDDQPVTRTVTYHNSGAVPVTLDLALHASGPDGSPTVAGLFALSAPTVTVPAAGDATVAVTTNTSRPGSEGLLGGELTATAGDITVQTPVAVDNEAEGYDLTLTLLDRTGTVTHRYDSVLVGLDTPTFLPLYDPSGTVKIRLPRGRYTLSTTVFSGDGWHPEFTELVQPLLNLDRSQQITLDARQGRPVSVTVPRPGAAMAIGVVGHSLAGSGGASFHSDLITADFGGVSTAQLGPAGKVDGFTSNIGGQWGRLQPDGSFLNSPYAYLLSWFNQGTFLTGFQRTVADRDLATVRVDLAVEATGVQGLKGAFARLRGSTDSGRQSALFPYDLPASRTEYYNADGDAEWSSPLMQQTSGDDPDGGFPETISENDSAFTTYRAGYPYHEMWNQGVFGPVFPTRVDPQFWVSRAGDSMIVQGSMYGDADGRVGYSTTDVASLVLYKDGIKIGETPALTGLFTVPAASGRYRVTVDSTRGAPFRLSTRNSMTWTFRSGHIDDTTPHALPLSVIRFAPTLDVLNRAPGNRVFALPIGVQHQPGSAAGSTRSLDLQVSYDDGRTWMTAAVLRPGDGDDGVALLRHPAGTGFVSLKAASTDSAGNTVEQTIIHAYRF
jgi:subtilisin family serine protease